MLHVIFSDQTTLLYSICIVLPTNVYLSVFHSETKSHKKVQYKELIARVIDAKRIDILFRQITKLIKDCVVFITIQINMHFFERFLSHWYICYPRLFQMSTITSVTTKLSI